MSRRLSTPPGTNVLLSRPLLSVWLVAGIVAAAITGAVLAQACGGGGAAIDITPTPTLAPAGTPTPESTMPAPQPITELRVAYINLLSPILTDANNTAAADTYDPRLDKVIADLNEFKPDIVGFSEATWTKLSTSAKERLVAGLKMEPAFVRANPWLPDQTPEDSEALVKLVGFEEGELVLVRSPFTLLGSQRFSLNPRTSETEGRAGLHLIVKAPDPLGEVDVFITHLTGGGERIRAQQANSFLTYVKARRGGSRPAIILGDFSDVPGSTTVQTIIEGGFTDVFALPSATPPDDGAEPTAEPAAEGGEVPQEPYPTCCRESVLGEQPPLTLRTDYIFTDDLPAPKVGLFGEEPGTLADGSLFYASDHNGIWAVFPIEAQPPPDSATMRP